MNLYHYPKHLLQQLYLNHEENETKACTVYSISFLYTTANYSVSKNTQFDVD